MERNFTLYRKLFTSTFYLSAFTFGGGYVHLLIIIIGCGILGFLIERYAKRRPIQ